MKKPLLFLLPLLLMVSASASPMRLDAAFSGTAVDLNGSGHSLTLAGSFVWLFDSDLIPASGQFSLPDQTLTSLNPLSVGVTSYTPANTYLSMNFFDGVLTGMTLDDRGHDGAGTGRDDFLVVLYGPGSFAGGLMFYSLASEPNVLGFTTDMSGSYSVTSVAVPDAASTGWLLTWTVLGLATAVKARRLTSAGH